ncbi:MFS transporter [Streptomyces sp. LHD-70]|uniref:MFS transporter n=1 Tax=Streptomyces sp. LHD-70 TaxID=3072140 RepID=UPI00280FC48C|nr:MFS transporter [Streptomyces sp. LHD-70]MDQ8702602.1 MFS transporter [Streptomyces sp. LHD-70]
MTIDVIDEAPTSPFHRKLLVACCGGPLLDGYLLSIVGVALVDMSRDLDLSTSTASVIGVAAIVGMFFGGLLIGPLTDRLGRRSMYTIDLTVLLVASLASVVAVEAWQVVALRFLIGFAIGADYPIATALLTEWCPRRMRGRAMGWVIMSWYFGALAAYVVGYAISLAVPEGGWRWMLASSAVLSLIVLFLRHGIPESPRWLIEKGRVEEARELVRGVLGRDVPSEQLSAPEKDKGGKGDLRTLFRGKYLRRLMFVSLFYTCQVVPMWAIYIFGPQLLGAFGFDEHSVGTLGAALVSLLFLIGCVPAMRLLETVGRRPVITWSFALMALPLLVLGLWADAPVAVVLGCFSLYAFFAGAPGILEWLYPNELFPTSIRASAVGMVVAFSKIGAAVGTYLVPLSLLHIGVSGTMYAGAAVTAVGFLACVAWAEETRGRTLDEAATDADDPAQASTPLPRTPLAATAPPHDA